MLDRLQRQRQRALKALRQANSWEQRFAALLIADEDARTTIKRITRRGIPRREVLLLLEMYCGGDVGRRLYALMPRREQASKLSRELVDVVRHLRQFWCEGGFVSAAPNSSAVFELAKQLEFQVTLLKAIRWTSLEQNRSYRGYWSQLPLDDRVRGF
jgi:hypothetical protein